MLGVSGKREDRGGEVDPGCSVSARKDRHDGKEV